MQLLGILNVTPDSHYDGGKYLSLENALMRGQAIEKEGGDWIDVGGESTWITADPVDANVELKRVIPVIKALKQAVSIPLSIDTMKARVADAALKAGASMINDVSGLSDPDMAKVARDHAVPVCIVHMQGTPKTMQIDPRYPRGATVEIIEWFEGKIEHMLASGIASSKIILDPGIGFGKTVAHNLEILHDLPRFKKLGFPLLLGLSRKSFMMRFLEKKREELLAASLAVASYSFLQEVEYLRVHDVESHRDAIKILDAVKRV